MTKMNMAGKIDHTNTICRICGNNKSDLKYINSEGKEIYHWRTYRDENGKLHKGIYVCGSCHQKCDIYSNHNLIKSMRLSRMGILKRNSQNGKSVIGQWIVAQVLGLSDNNIENDNFKEAVDLSRHTILGNVEVKSPSIIEGKWRASIGTEHNFDSLAIICMDNNDPWKHVKRICIIPESELYGETQIIICEDWHKLSRLSKFEWIEKYRIDEKPFDDVYQSIDTPEFFNPFDLWKGKYKRRVDNDD